MAGARSSGRCGQGHMSVKVGSGVYRMVDISRPGSFGIGKAGPTRKYCDLTKFYATPGVPPPPAGVKPKDVDLKKPGPHVCPVVWCSLAAGHEESFCTAVGEPGHGKGGTAHVVPAGWRKKYVNGLMCLLCATAPTPGAPRPPLSAPTQQEGPPRPSPALSERQAGATRCGAARMLAVPRAAPTALTRLAALARWRRAAQPRATLAACAR